MTFRNPGILSLHSIKVLLHFNHQCKSIQIPWLLIFQAKSYNKVILNPKKPTFFKSVTFSGREENVSVHIVSSPLILWIQRLVIFWELVAKVRTVSRWALGLKTRFKFSGYVLILGIVYLCHNFASNINSLCDFLICRTGINQRHISMEGK